MVTVVWQIWSMGCFFACLPYEWRPGTSDGLFLPIYPPRGMRSSTLLRGLINFCNKYMSSLWLMWVHGYTHTHPSTLLASIIPRNFCRYHVAIIYLPHTATIPTYYGISIDILPCNFHHHHIHNLSIYFHIALHDRKIASMIFSWLVRFLMSLRC